MRGFWRFVQSWQLVAFTLRTTFDLPPIRRIHQTPWQPHAFSGNPYTLSML
jgi:hypothetical protein